MRPLEDKGDKTSSGEAEDGIGAVGDTSSLGR